MNIGVDKYLSLRFNKLIMENDNIDREIDERIRKEAERQLEADRIANEAHKQRTLAELARLAAEEAERN